MRNQHSQQVKPTHSPTTHLTPKAQRFVAEYCKDFNGTQAAIRAGYSPTNARSQSSQMLGNVGVREAIREIGERTFTSTEAYLARVVEELALLAFFDPASALDDDGKLRPLRELPPETRRALAN